MFNFNTNFSKNINYPSDKKGEDMELRTKEAIETAKIITLSTVAKSMMSSTSQIKLTQDLLDLMSRYKDKYNKE